MANGENIKRNFRIPSLGAILHFIIVEVVTQAIWFGVSRMITNTWIKDIGILIVFVAAIFAVAWYLPKLSISSKSKKPSQITKFIDGLGWLEEKTKDQWSNPLNYIYSKIIKIYPSSSTEIGLDIEWFNCSAFGLKIESVSGELRMSELGFNFDTVVHQITLIDKPTLNMFSKGSCTCHVLVGEQKVTQINDVISKRKSLSWKPNLTYQLSTIGYSDRLITFQLSMPIILMPTNQ